MPEINTSPSNSSRPEAPFVIQRSVARSSGFFAAVPALLLLGLGYALSPPPSERPITEAIQNPGIPAANAVDVLPISQTMVVGGGGGGFSLLRGELQPVVRATGQAPVSGQVARVYVQPGQNVEVGDRVIQLSTGASSRPPVAMERAQTAAEAAQVAAARQQDALQTKMQKAQARLREAQARVDAAQQRMTHARELVARLKRGENVASPEEEPRSAVPAGPSPAVRAADKAQREAEAAAREAERATAKATAAKRAADAAQAEAKQKKLKQQEAESNLAKVQEKFDAKIAKGSDIEAARTAGADAQAEASEAASKASKAAEEADRLAAAATPLTARAKQLADTARKLEQKVQPGERAAAGRKPAARRREGGSNISVEEAARIVAAAVEESDSAIKAADAIKRQVDGYERQARSTQQRLDQTSSRLEAAQERVMENTIAANLSSVRAPASGTVSWVASIASEVSAGDRLITVVNPNMLEVRFRDYTNAWQQLKPGAALPALVHQQADAPTTTASPATAGFKPGRDSATVAETAALTETDPNATPVVVRLRSITPPTQPGAPAMLRAVVYNPPQKSGSGGRFGRQLTTGLPIVCSVTKPGAQVSVSVPAAAIRTDHQGAPCVAVLSPLPESSEVDGTVPDELYRVEWRKVTVGKGDGIQQTIQSGLRPGERIALQPEELFETTREHGPEATIRLATT